ncbi:DgyrCDS13122 [Dimorphilus gyrociliatus]|uniref:DgyrCDS13122 n=1 Tax=Dimorphilus gyrociliatus TaxID=2664684 RepID=A0A7I8W9P9_9ANNE|nr:DgyrCDS13122 [Dimorphilus gyrociliatus]
MGTFILTNGALIRILRKYLRMRLQAVVEQVDEACGNLVKKVTLKHSKSKITSSSKRASEIKIRYNSEKYLKESTPPQKSFPKAASFNTFPVNEGKASKSLLTVSDDASEPRRHSVAVFLRSRRESDESTISTRSTRMSEGSQAFNGRLERLVESVNCKVRVLRQQSEHEDKMKRPYTVDYNRQCSYNMLKDNVKSVPAVPAERQAYFNKQLSILQDKLHKKAYGQQKDLILARLMTLCASSFIITWLPFCVLFLLSITKTSYNPIFQDIAFKVLLSNLFINPLLNVLCKAKYAKGFLYVWKLFLYWLTFGYADGPSENLIFYQVRPKKRKRKVEDKYKAEALHVRNTKLDSDFFFIYIKSYLPLLFLIFFFSPLPFPFR